MAISIETLTNLQATLETEYDAQVQIFIDIRDNTTSDEVKTLANLAIDGLTKEHVSAHTEINNLILKHL